jgi:glycosyltransferase involved in cell wall biosynthesis
MNYLNDTNFRLPLVSVIIPTKNRHDLLVRAIKSVLNQTYSNLEIIIVDDSSSDETKSHIYKIKDERIKYIFQNNRKGGAAARNTGILNAKGEFISFLDDDDYWAPEKIEKQLHVFKTHEKICAVYSGYFIVEAKKGKIIGAVKPKYHGNIYKRLLTENCVGTTSTVIVKSKVLINELFDESLPSCQDWDLWLRLSKFHEFWSVNEPLVYYSFHGNQISSNPEAILRGRLMFLEKHWDEIVKDKNALCKHYQRIGAYYCLRGDVKTGRKYLLRSLSLRPLSAEGIFALSASILGSKYYGRLINQYRKYKYSRHKYDV